MPTSPISLPDNLQHFFQSQIDCGKYQTADEVVGTALSLLLQREQKLASLRKDIQVSVEQIEQGQFIEIGNQEALQAFFDNIQQRGQKRLDTEKYEQ